MATEPNTGLTWQEANSLTTDALHNQLLDFVSVWVNCVVLNVGQAAPTGSEAEGDCYIVGTGTGVFAGHDDELAILRGGTWQFHAPPDAGVPIIKNLDDGTDWECVAGVWAAKSGGGGGSTRNTVTALATSGSVAIDYALGDYFTLALAGNVSGLTFSNLPGSGKGATLAVRITQDSTPRTVAWPASFKWVGAAPSVSTASGAMDLLVITTHDNGTTWLADLAKAYA